MRDRESMPTREGPGTDVAMGPTDWKALYKKVHKWDLAPIDCLYFNLKRKGV